MTGLMFNQPTRTDEYYGNWYWDHRSPRKIYRLIINTEIEVQRKFQAVDGPFYFMNPKYPFAYVVGWDTRGEMSIVVDASVGPSKAAEFMEELLQYQGVSSARWSPYNTT